MENGGFNFHFFAFSSAVAVGGGLRAHPIYYMNELI